MIKRIIATIVSMTLLIGGLTTTASAAVIGTPEAFTVATVDQPAQRIARALARQDVQQALITLGVSPEQAKLRVASLDEFELAQLDAQLENLPAGEGALALIGAVFVVLLILEVTGVINVFKGV